MKHSSKVLSYAKYVVSQLFLEIYIDIDIKMFRRRKAGKMLSANELKTKLYSHLDKTGSLNRIRIELREKLISELLKKAAPVETVDNNPLYTFDRTVLPLQISNWLIYDHLLRQDYQYALSVFVTEANFPTHPEKLLAACDILILLGLDSTSPEYISISQMCSNTNAQLTHSLLVAVIKCLFDLTTREGRFSEAKEENVAQGESEDKVFVHERNSDCELPEFKASDKFLDYQKGAAELNLHDQVLLIKEEKEKEVQQLRHKLLQELDRLHSQERKQQLEIKQLQTELQKERDDLFSEKEKLRQKELLMNKEYENKLEKKTRELEIDFLSRIHAKEKDQEICLQKLHEKEQSLNLLEMNLSNQRESYNSLKREMEDMKQLYTTLQTKYSVLLDENTNLLKKFESMSDYAVLKGDLETRSRELKNLHLEFEEYRQQIEKERESFRENLQKLDMKLRIKEPELLEAQKQVNLVRDTLHMEETVWNKERRKLEQEVMTSREMYQTLIQRIEEQKEDIHALHRTIHILHYQLTDKSARNTARVEPFIPNRSSFRVTDISSKQPDILRINRGTDDSPSKYRQKSLKFIEDAKDRITKLQQEADALQYKSSVVYNSTPKLTSHITSNPLLLNFTSQQRFQPYTSHAVKPFITELPSTNFENLIHNELPTLDLNFPAHIKNQRADAYTHIYKSGSPINPAGPEKTASTDSDGNLKCSENLSKNAKEYFTLQSDTTVKNNQIINSELPKADRITEQYELTKINDSRVLPGELFDKKRISAPMTSNFQGYGKFDSSLIKTGNGIDNLSENNVQSTQKLSTTLQENLTPDHTRNLNKKLSQSNESKSAAPEELENKNTDSESNMKKSTLSFQNAPPETQVILDLDAAWKRKSSLKSSILTPLHKKPLTEIISKEIDIAQMNSNQLQSKSQDPLAIPSRKIFSENSKEADLCRITGHHSFTDQGNHQESNSKNSKLSENSIAADSSHGMGHWTVDPGSTQESKGKAFQLSENLEETDSSLRLGHHSIEPQNTGQDSKSGIIKLHETEVEVEKTKEPFVDKIGIVDANISKPMDTYDEQKEVSIDPKPVYEDSLSELSEIHLSCGSEQEQQKDSDNW